MSNPLYSRLGGNQSNLPIAQMIDNFNKFRQGYTPESAKAEVERLLQTGQMTQQQFNELYNMAGTVMRYMGRKK